MGYATQIETTGGAKHLIGASLYGICSVPSTDVEKNVTLDYFDTLLPGVMVQVKFTNTNGANNPTLNVNSTGAFPIYAHGTTAPGKTPALSWAANSIVSFTFDGNAWRMNDVGANNAIITMLEGQIASEAAARVANDTTILARIAPVYDATQTYRLNDLVTYNGQLYRANVDITTAEAWTSAHWTATTVAAEREYKLVFHDTVVGVASTVSAEAEGTGVAGANVNKSQWEAIIRTTGEYVFSYTGTDWMFNEGIVIPSNYGVEIVTNTATVTISGSGISEATVNADTFREKESTSGTYTFTYTSSAWKLNGTTVVIADYGITTKGTAANNDTITVVFTARTLASGDTVTVTYTAGQAAFVYTNTYPEYPYRAIVPLTGVKAAMIPQVTYGLTEAISGMYAPIANTFDGEVHLYATNEPTGSITIPTIILWG